ncbi:partitioning defective 3 homolog B-like [Conger conger]|uniref:partitioning defective 3 homolog B-like n=1 Tax=Conger conger TaxID=82655 RepID=UPI002A5A19A8|nr:partitioning defective 3 homolog B-like [Conger conger]
METLRRSMSMEGNLRGMIQLVVGRTLQRPGQESYEQLAPLSRAMDSAPGQAPLGIMGNGTAMPSTILNSVYERSAAPDMVPNGRYYHMEEEEDEDEFPPPPSSAAHLEEDASLHRPHAWSPNLEPGSYPPEPLHPATQLQSRQAEHHHVKSSKSMDLVADESNMRSLAGHKSAETALSGAELGPTLGLKKSSSLESLQTAVTEAARKSELPFHRPRAHMVRGRGCNESFRAAIDKSYDGPPELDEDDLSDPSSGRDTPASGSSRQGLADTEEGKKDKKKKAKGKKKEKKSKGKEKEKKKGEDGEEQDKKTKKKGFALLRYGMEIC